ncbi:hypothetical protein L1049_008056 [Liquidambar formosana]|uniref:Uncharacterized protein n=1 Tax=Liquidambar formosana TaxID=63359 RepID=A0AAP0S936_LIQFO
METKASRKFEKLKPIIVKKFLESNGSPPKELEFFDKFENQIKEKDIEKWSCEMQTILVNHFGSDEDVAKLFNEIAADMVPEVDIYTKVQWDIRKYLSCPRKAKIAKWLAEVYRDHFKSPWAASAVVAAFIILAATIVQTYFTVFPRADKFN